MKESRGAAGARVLCGAGGYWYEAAMRFSVGSFGLFTFLAVVTACGGQKPAEAPAAESAAAAESSEAAPAEASKAAGADEGASTDGVPTKCFKSGSICSPDPKF